VHKSLAAVAISGALLLSLTACVPNASNPGASDCSATPSGDQSAKITVTGAFGSEPVVTIPAPLTAKVTERDVVIRGDGDVVEHGMIASVNYVLYSAQTGELLEASKFSEDGDVMFPVDEESLLAGMVKILECTTVGSRVVGIVPAAEAFGVQGPQFGIGATDSIVFVFDVTDAADAPEEPEPAPLPEPKPWNENVPDVDLSGDVPVVTLPEPMAEELFLAVLEEGDGAVVEADSTVLVDYQGTSWDTGEIFDQSYTRGEPASFKVTQVIPGFSAAMVGQKVGSTLLVTIPPELAYGTDPARHALGGQTLVFLIEIRDAS
jgi:peptidylprolyl isomerase